MSSSTYTGRPMSPVDSQMDLMKPHVTRAVPMSPKRDTPQHTFVLAKPPEWSASGLCVGDFARFDESVGLKTGEAAARCAGCPVIEQCLAAALAEEGTLSAGSRYGIRGALSPKERAELAYASRECDRGHVGRWRRDKPNTCLECLAENGRERYRLQKLDPAFMERKVQQVRASRAASRVACLECRTEMVAENLDRHLGRRHGQNGVAA